MQLVTSRHTDGGRQSNYHNSVSACSALTSAQDCSWTPDKIAAAFDLYYDGHERLLLDPEARNGRHTHIEPGPQQWRVSQVLTDPDSHNDWQAVFIVPLAAAREEGKPSLVLSSLGPVAS